MINRNVYKSGRITYTVTNSGVGLQHSIGVDGLMSCEIINEELYKTHSLILAQSFRDGILKQIADNQLISTTEVL